MQPTDLQVRRSLEALTSTRRDEPRPNPAGGATTRGTGPDTDLCVEVAAGLGDGPVIRPERLEEARQRLVAGSRPTAGDLADRMVGRLVCDRLR